MTPRRPLALLGSTAALVASAALMPSAAQARTKLCPGTVTFSSTDTKLAVRGGARCATARAVARIFDEEVSGGSGGKRYSCFYAHAPFAEKFGRQVGFTCRSRKTGSTKIYGLIEK